MVGVLIVTRGMKLDAKLRWKVHVKTKREELGIKYR